MFEPVFEQFNRLGQRGMALPMIKVPVPDQFDPSTLRCETYTDRHDGPVLVVGSAPCIFDDLQAAHELHPDAAICCLNEAVAAVFPDFIATCHAEKMTRFLDLARASHGKGCEPILLAQGSPSEHRPAVPEGTHFWQVAAGAGSAAFATKVLLAIGFSPVIWCGCPLNGGDGYFNDEITVRSTPSDPRLGFVDSRSDLACWWREQLAKMAKYPAFAEVYSMSGYSRAVLGPPPGVEA